MLEKGKTTMNYNMFPVITICWFVLVLSDGFSITERGKKYSNDPSKQYRVYFEDEDGLISPWHDIPLLSDNQTYNMVVEIPRWSQAKFEISRELSLNPIIQDQEDDTNRSTILIVIVVINEIVTTRYLPNVFPWHGHVCNYGALPQTWENPFHDDPWTGIPGDRDPLDACEVGTTPVPTGTVVQVRVLGILGLLDSSETDWKVIVINAEEAKAHNINNLEDLNTLYPGIVDEVRTFFRVYKVPSGKPENNFAYNGEYQDSEFAKDIIR